MFTVNRMTRSFFVRKLHGQEGQSRMLTRLFARHGVPLSGQTLRNGFSMVYHRYAGNQLRFSDYRHVVIAFSRHHLKMSSTEDGEELVYNGEILDQQAGHTSEIAGQLYARGNFDLRYLDPNTAHNYYLCSKEWQKLLRRFK